MTSTEEVKRDIEEARAGLAEDTLVLREKLQFKRRLGSWTRAHLVVMVAVGFALGVLLGLRR